MKECTNIRIMILFIGLFLFSCKGKNKSDKFLVDKDLDKEKQLVSFFYPPSSNCNFASDTFDDHIFSVKAQNLKKKIFYKADNTYCQIRIVQLTKNLIHLYSDRQGLYYQDSLQTCDESLVLFGQEFKFEFLLGYIYAADILVTHYLTLANSKFLFILTTHRAQFVGCTRFYWFIFDITDKSQIKAWSVKSVDSDIRAFGDFDNNGTLDYINQKYPEIHWISDFPLRSDRKMFYQYDFEKHQIEKKYKYLQDTIYLHTLKDNVFEVVKDKYLIVKYNNKIRPYYCARDLLDLENSRWFFDLRKLKK